MAHADLEPKDIGGSVKKFHQRRKSSTPNPQAGHSVVLSSPLWSALKRTWHFFCTKTSIHGLKFTNEASTNRAVRLIWWLITVVCFVCSISMVIDFYFDYRSNPTRMNLENDFAPVANLYFPSVTICPETVLNMKKAERYFEKLKLPPSTNVDSMVEQLSFFNGLFDEDIKTVFNASSIALFEEVLTLNGLSIERFFFDLKWDCEDFLFRCRIHFQITPCEELFQVARTFLGFCCSFNLNQTGIRFTKVTARAGVREGLSIILHNGDSDYERSKAYSFGFRILVDEVPIFPSSQSFVRFVAYNEEVFAAIRPVETFCSAAVEALPIEERLCAFPYEIPLKNFPQFAGAHCELDCNIENSFKYCGCIPYVIPHNRTKCSFKDIPCMMKNFDAIVGRYRDTQCSCLNECEMMDYDIQLTNTELRFDVPTVDAFYDGIKENYSVVHLFMNGQVYRRVRRDLLSNTITLVSNLGSAFSLFVGMSMVSVVEIIFYFTVVLHRYYIEEVERRERMLFKRRESNKI